MAKWVMPAVSGTLNCPGGAVKKRGASVSVRRRPGWDFGGVAVFATTLPPVRGDEAALANEGRPSPAHGEGYRRPGRPRGLA